MSETRSTGESPDLAPGESPAGSYGGVPAPETPETTTGATSGGGTSSSLGSSGLGSSDAGQAGGGGREWLGQLQGMIDNLATQAAPVVREVAAKAAELAAAAGEKAGPIAHRAAEVTEAAGAKLAERGRVVASDLRSGEGESQGAAAGDFPNTIEPGPGAGASVSPAGSTGYDPDARTVSE
jgi:hypothetical protein